MNGNNDPHRYDDIINLPHPVSTKHPRMSIADRAAQFSPFSALSGHAAAIQETARLTDRRIELDESAKAVLDTKLQLIAEQAGARPVVAITYFVPDERKAGGAYAEKLGTVKRVDGYRRTVVFTDGTDIAIDDILKIDGALFSNDMKDKTAGWGE